MELFLTKLGGEILVKVSTNAEKKKVGIPIPVHAQSQYFLVDWPELDARCVRKLGKGYLKLR